jgi:hypothetical protein
MAESPPSSFRLTLCSYRTGLGAVLAVAAGFRVWLAFAGGQGWWPDEQRFQISVEAAEALLHGHWHLAFTILIDHAYHLGFGYLGLLPGLAGALGLQPPIVALFFGAVSLANIYLVARIAQVVTRREDVAFWSGLAAAASNSLFYYSSHYLPYDASLCLGLGGLYWGVRNSSERALGVSGVCAGLGFVIYNGYWLFCGVTLGLAVLHGTTNFRSFLRRAAWGLGGLLATLGTIVMTARLAGSDLIGAGVEMSRQIILGDFSEGWTFPFEYLFHAEGALLVLWLLAFTAVLAGPLWRAPRHLYFWAAAIALIYVVLAALSAVFHQFVLYGRVVRCLAPLNALLCGGVIAECRRWARGGTRIQWASAGAIMVAATINLSVPLRQWYPQEYYKRAREIAGKQPPEARLLALNVHNTPTLEFPEEYPIEKVLFSRPHPLQYAPFLYEGLTAEVRRQHRARQFPMQVVQLRATTTPWTWGDETATGHPGPVVITLHLPQVSDGSADPLVATGFARGADWLTVSREAPNRFRFKYYHWGDSTLASELYDLDEKMAHRLIVSFGSMVAPDNASNESSGADLVGLRRLLYVAVDDTVVFNQPQTFFPSRANNIEVGHNSLDGTRTEPAFRGKILRVEPFPAGELARRLGGFGGNFVTNSPLDGHPGPTRIRVSAAALSGGEPQILLASGPAGAGDLLRLVPLGPGRLRLDVVHDGGSVISRLLKIDQRAEHDFVVSLGSLMPPASAPIYRQRPETAVLRRWLFVSMDGQCIINLEQPAHRSPLGLIRFMSASGSSFTAAIPLSEFLDQL